MKTKSVKEQLFTSQKATPENLVNNWVLTTKQFSYWHRELTEVIENHHLTNQTLVTATFHSNGRWPKIELIALQVDLCTRLSSLLTRSGAAQPNQTALVLSNRLREDTQHIMAWCQQIQTALGLDSVEGD